MRLTKHHGLGNDFLVLFDDPDPGPALARRLCDRRRGVGADGLILGRVGGRDGTDVTMVLRNADGSRAEMSGNGIRCLAQAVLRRAGRAQGTVVVATEAGQRRVEITATDDPLTCQATVDMGPPACGPAWPGTLPDDLVAQLGPGRPRLQTVDVGNPHLVVLAADPAVVDLQRFGPQLEAQVPGGVNVGFMAARLGHADEIDLRVWERGAGLTGACGTGATAAAYAAQRWGLVGRTVSVRQPGGDVVVRLGRSAVLVGPATFVADVELPAIAEPAGGSLLCGARGGAADKVAHPQEQWEEHEVLGG